ncbi:hypothetical protein [Halapricum hydrolyticum]|uniref:Uncharacterized protein n=1 Tax=Halapricum hydrolyticum TaxID=2979991 RepID=A0AAE3I9S6_9EURY|nr:hypothetical protein [Halapricum hydrolyticum]MCU4718379.1 hypothetical protein [Halapricum hydrolyticum]MCU4726508.1 hypothetical protein [Halapricum hydrolyticum]
MSQANYDCPQCGGRLESLDVDAFECRKCGREIREVVVEGMDAFERVAEDDENPLQEVAQAALEGVRE